MQHCRIVLRASPNEEWNQIEEDATKLDLDVLNKNPVLKENKIFIEAIQKGCLVVCFNTANNVSLEESLYNLFSVMFEFLKIDSKLQKSDVSTFQVNGYIYIPENFKKGKFTELISLIINMFHSKFLYFIQHCTHLKEISFSPRGVLNILSSFVVKYSNKL